MTLAHIPLNQITAADLQALCDNGVGESHRLEFKRDQYATNNEGKREFTKDVSALANTFGGDLIIGIDEDDQGNAGRIEPIVFQDLDSQTAAWLNILRDCIQPRIVGLDLRPIAVDGGHVVIIRVPKSFNPPHRSNGGGSHRYYVRNPRGAHEASVEELRALFLQGSTIIEKIRRFHAERTALISENCGVYQFSGDGGRIVIHIQPLSAYGNHEQLSPAEINNENARFRPVGSDIQSWSPRINIDGAAVSASDRNGTVGYCQVFRDGRVEYARNPIWGVMNDRKLLGAKKVEGQILCSAADVLLGLQALMVQPPFVVSASVTDVRGSTLLLPNDTLDFGPNYPYEHDLISLPEIVLEEYRADGNYQPALRPMIDGLWNAYGHESSPNFDANGNWTDRC